MPNCEGRSRRSGVILYSDDNDHFVVYTSPPLAAELLLKEKPFGECTLQLLPSVALDFAPNHAPVARRCNRRRTCGARPKGKYSSERMALALIRTCEFSLPRGAGQVGRATPCFHPIDFCVTRRLFVSFLIQEKNVTPSFLFRPHLPLPAKKPPGKCLAA